MLVFLNSGDFSREKRKFDKKNVKCNPSQQELRAQRILYLLSLRKSKRDLILEEKRHVMEKINWTTAWEDEDDELDLVNTTHEEVLTSLVSLAQNYEINVNELVQCLDLLRKMIDREMKTKFGPVSSQMQETPGNIANSLFDSEIYGLLSHLFSMSASHSPPEASLVICREVSSIFKELTRFKDVHAPPSSLTLPRSCLQILEDESADLICYTNAFLILHNTLHDKSSEHVSRIGKQILRHLSVANALYGPEDELVQSYIKSITVLMSSFVRLVSDKTLLISDVFNFFSASLSSLAKLIQLNDPEVTLNVLVFLQTMSESPVGVDILISPASQTLVDFLIHLVSVGHTRADVPLKILASLSTGNTSFAKSLSETSFLGILNQYLVGPQLPVAQILTVFCTLGPTTIHLLLTAFGSNFRAFIDDCLYFGDKVTQRAVVSLLHAFTETGQLTQIWTVFDKDLADTLKGCLSPEDIKTTCLTLESYFNLIKKSSPAEREAFVKQTATSLVPCFEDAFACGDPEVSEMSAKLLDFYLYA